MRKLGRVDCYFFNQCITVVEKVPDIAQKMKFSIKDVFSKCDQIYNKLRIWSHLLNKPLIENFIFCAVFKQCNYVILALTKLLRFEIYSSRLLNKQKYRKNFVQVRAWWVNFIICWNLSLLEWLNLNIKGVSSLRPGISCVV